MNLSRRFTITGCGIILYLILGSAVADVVVVVSIQSPVTVLSRTQLSDIFLGKQNSLPDGTPVVPVDQAEGRSVRKQFYHEYLGRSTVQIKTYWSKLIFTGRGHPPRIVVGDDKAADFIAENPDTIGYIDKEHVNGHLRVIAIE